MNFLENFEGFILSSSSRVHEVYLMHLTWLNGSEKNDLMLYYLLDECLKDESY